MTGCQNEVHLKFWGGRGSWMGMGNVKAWSLSADKLSRIKEMLAERS
jgi:hypothetical protein